MVMLWAFTFSPIIKVQCKIAKQNAKELILEMYGDTEIHPFSHLNHYGRKGRKGTIIAKDRILTGVFATIALKARKKHSRGRHHFLVLPGTWEKHGWYFDCNIWDLWVAMFSCIEISVQNFQIFPENLGRHDLQPARWSWPFFPRHCIWSFATWWVWSLLLRHGRESQERLESTMTIKLPK